MNGLLPALAGGLIAAGIVGVVASLRPTPAAAPRPPRTRLARLRVISLRTRLLALGGLVVGVLVAVLSGWLVAAVVVPAAFVGVPLLVSAPEEKARIARLEALAEWTRNLAGVLTVGVGLEQALVATLRSTPTAIKPEVSRLVARLRARWSTEDALLAFADELDDATGDLVAAYLILGARRRGTGLASVLQGLAESVAEDVTIRRRVEADRAKPRTTARHVTLITVVVLALLSFSGQIMAPYGTPLGQALLAVLLTVYGATLVWMRRMSLGEPLPRFLTRDGTDTSSVTALGAGVRS
ncbi:MAG: type II secretion system F family protein [Nigerium sp.]|nr:type II secretion system F family protein [Nigerium sp.]